MKSIASEGAPYIPMYGDEAPEVEGYVYMNKEWKTNFSSTFLYRRQQDGELYVGKVLNNNCTSFNKEVEFLSYFKEDKTVVDIADVIKTKNNEDIMMTKYCKFGDLWEFLYNMGNISPLLFYKIFIELVKAVFVLHENNIYHGDIKPNNFLVEDYEEETEDIHIVISDFGFAKDLDYKLTCLNPDGYTPNYAAPEVTRNEPVSLSADIFSLGMVFDFIYNKLNGCIPQYIYMLIYRMTEENPKNRPTIKEIIKELIENQNCS